MLASPPAAAEGPIDAAPDTPTWRPWAAGLVVATLLAGALAATGWTFRAIDALVLAWLIAAAASLPHDRDAWIVVGVTAVTHALTWGPRIHLHANKAFSTFETARRMLSPDVRYGDGWPALIGMPFHLMGQPPLGVLWIDGVLSVLSAAWLVDVVRRATDDRRLALVSGLLWAVLPWPCAMGGTETRFVAVAVLQVMALDGLVRRDRVGDVLALTSLAMLAWVRPLQIAVAALGVVVLGARRRWAAAVGLIVLLGLRAAPLWAFAQQPGGTNGTQGALWFASRTWGSLVGDDGRLAFLDPSLTPLGVGVLAIGGVALAVRRPGLRWFAGALVVAIGPYLVQPLVADRLRFQLPAQAWIAVLAAAALLALAERQRLVAGVVAMGIAASFWPARQPYPPFVWQAEFTQLQTVMPKLAPGSIVHYDATWDPGGAHFSGWATRASAATWVVRPETLPPGALVWVGMVDHVVGMPPGDDLESVDTVVAAPEGGGVFRFDGPVELGLFRVR